MDAFGREVSSYNSQGLTVGVSRDTCGRVTGAADPYTTAYVSGTTTTYDALGRVTRTTDSAGKPTTFVYSGSEVTRTGLEQQTVNCGLGAYWCPGQISKGNPNYSDIYFDPSHYGYQGGEELARAEEQYSLNVAIQFAQQVKQYFAQKEAEQALKFRTVPGSGPIGDVQVMINGEWQPCTVDNGCIKLGMVPLSPGAIGEAGETIVKSLANIGLKKGFPGASGAWRIADGFLDDIISEVKNVNYQALTSQIRDYISFAQTTGQRFDLWVREGPPGIGTTLSGPLKDAIAADLVNLRTFVWYK